MIFNGLLKPGAAFCIAMSDGSEQRGDAPAKFDKRQIVRNQLRVVEPVQ